MPNSTKDAVQPILVAIVTQTAVFFVFMQRDFYVLNKLKEWK